jgi:hypothetical protein
VVLDLIEVAILGLELLRQGPLIDSIGVELLIILRGDKRLHVEPAANINAVEFPIISNCALGRWIDSPSNTIHAVLELLIERRGEALRPAELLVGFAGSNTQ